MNIEEDNLIQDFLKNKLSEKERASMLLKIENDEHFREKVKLQEQLILNLSDSGWSISQNMNHPDIKEYEHLLRDESTIALKDTLSKINSKYQQQQKRIKLSKILYTGAAVVLLIIGVTIFSTPDISSDQLYTNYINLSELPSLVVRGKNNQNKNLLIKAQKLFESQKYEDALAILTNDLDATQKNKATTYLYIGISQMELNKFDESENTFNLLINSNLIDSPKGNWYKALLYLKTNRQQKTKEELKKIIANSNNYKFKEATELLNKL